MKRDASYESSFPCLLLSHAMLSRMTTYVKRERRLSYGSVDRNKQPTTHADGLLMTPSEAIVVGGFEKPAKATSTSRPKHEITGHFARYGIACRSVLSEM